MPLFREMVCIVLCYSVNRLAGAETQEELSQ